VPSGRKPSRPDASEPVFFLDRGLGVNYVAERIRKRGYEVLPMVDVYPGGSDQAVSTTSGSLARRIRTGSP